ncbi:MAG: N-acetylmuramoyl-L-alanine amidase [Methylobacteriaceae bacterium]|nr:N-acetylmuramoyl-L-alanine amidase [Methylobacteriaceae bacterium]
MKPTEGLALFSGQQDMENLGLGDFLLPPAQSPFPGLGRRLDPKKPYFACRWWQSGLSRDFLRSTWAWIENSQSGARMRARPVDSGPAESTGRVADLSPGLAAALRLKTDDVCTVTIDDSTSEFGSDFSHAATSAPTAFSGPKVYTTAEWGAVPAKVSFFPEKPAVGIVIHNTEYPNRPPFADTEAEKAAAFANARTIQLDHMNNRGWSDTGQHFTISQGGVITEGRHGTLAAAAAGHVARGAHAPGANDDWWGIEIAGNHVAQYLVTDQQWASLVALCKWLTRLAGHALQIEPHDHFVPTDCPGKIADHIDDLRAQVGG